MRRALGGKGALGLALIAALGLASLGGRPSLHSRAAAQNAPAPISLATPVADWEPPALVRVEVQSAGKAVAPGETAAYSFTVTNTGALDAPVTISVVLDRSGWAAVICADGAPCTRTVARTLSPGETLAGTLRVSAPEAALLGDEAAATLVVTKDSNLANE
jgi:hypothetical protein